MDTSIAGVWARVQRNSEEWGRLPYLGMVQMSQIPGNIICGFIGCGILPQGGMVAPLLELCHPQAALEAATRN